MLDRIIRFSLQNRLTILAVIGVLLVWGCMSMLRTDIDIFPDLNAPKVVVMTEAPGMTPEDIEQTITYPIETALNGATDVRRVRSSSTTGFSIVWVEFDWDADPYKARQIVSEKLSNVADRLPPGSGVPVLGPQSSILGELMIIGLTSDSTSLMQLRSIADRVLAPRLLALGGVSQVSVIGGDVAEYQIQLDMNRMKFLDVSLEEVRDAVENLNLNASGGVLYDYGNEYLIKAELHTTSHEDIAKSVIRSDERGIVTIADIANVVFGAQSPKLGLASLNGKNAVLLTVTKQYSGSTLDITEDIDEMLNDVKHTLPTDININSEIFRQGDFISSSISNLQTSLFEGAIFVIIVLFIFLMNIRTTIISVTAIPLSIIITMLVLNLLGMTINTMSLGGIAIAIGSLVDDAIVDVENVYRRLRLNYSLPESERRSIREIVFEASREVRLPILNSTLIIAASFLPLFFLSGIEGRMLVPLGISFLTSLLVSTFVALTLTPVMCSYMLGKKENSNTENKEPLVAKYFGDIYKKVLEKSFCYKKSILAVSLFLFVSAIACFFTLGRGFLPSFNEGSLTINIATLPGISLEESDNIGRRAEEIILSVPEIKLTSRKTGRAELDEHSLGVNMSEIEVPYVLSDRSRSEMVNELREKLSHLPGTNIEIGQPISHRIDAMLSGSKSQIAIKIFGSDLETLIELANKVKTQISSIEGIVDVNVEQQSARPQMDIRPRRDMLARYGITNEQFATTVATMLSGEVVSQVYTEGISYDVVVKVDPSQRERFADIANILIDSNIGKIPLSYVADIVSSSGPNTINRENVKRRIMVSANIDGVDLRGAINNIKDALDENVILPEGFYIEYAGQFENEQEASRTLAFASFGAILLILLLLMHEYKNLPQTLVILTNMPMALIGGILILFVLGRDVSIPAVIGFISLMGIATRGGMLLMSRYNSLKQEGASIMDRIIRGSRDRLNPIIMTALTSALALIPLAMRGDEPGNEIQSPMAIVILGGLVSSTILNLFIVPILYYYISKRAEK